MKTITLLVCALVSVALLPNFLIPPSVSADGGVFVDFRQLVYLPEQKAAILWDGTRETLTLSTKIRSDDLANMAWVIPIPSKMKPEVEEGDIRIFVELARIFSKNKSYRPFDPVVVIVPVGLSLIGSFVSAIIYVRRRRRGFLYLSILFTIVSLVSFVLSVMWMGSLAFAFMGEGGVEPIEIKKVDIYDIAILKATNATALVGWLNENGYTVPESAVPVLQEYCDKEDFYFIANKINLEDRYTTAAERSRILSELREGMATPLKITFQPDAPFYPQKISSINNGTTHINVYFISRYQVFEDKSGILRINPFTSPEPADRLGEEYKDNWVTLLEYSGDLKNLRADSVF